MIWIAMTFLPYLTCVYSVPEAEVIWSSGTWDAAAYAYVWWTHFFLIELTLHIANN
jgi:hypothetical protein